VNSIWRLASNLTHVPQSENTLVYSHSLANASQYALRKNRMSRIDYIRRTLDFTGFPQQM